MNINRLLVFKFIAMENKQTKENINKSRQEKRRATKAAE